MKKVCLLAAVAAAMTMGTLVNAADMGDKKDQCLLKVGDVNVGVEARADGKNAIEVAGKAKLDDKGAPMFDAWFKADDKLCAELNTLLSNKAFADKAVACDANAACKAFNTKAKVKGKDGKEVEMAKIDFDAVKKAEADMAKKAMPAAPVAPVAPAAAPAPAAPAAAAPAMPAVEADKKK